MSSLLQGRYQVEETPHMNGGMSKVYRATDSRLNDRVVALKTSFFNGDPSLESQVRFHHRREIELLSGFNPPHLPHLYDFFEEGTALYIVEEFIPGKNLAEYVSENGKLKEIDALNVMLQVCSALKYCHDHRGKDNEKDPICHLDLKPQNVIFYHNLIKVVDFGISNKVNKSLTVLINPRNLGSPGYAAPEQYSSAYNTDLRSDIYAAGALLYFLLTGEDPAEADTRKRNQKDQSIGNKLSSLNPAIRCVISKATALKQKDRYRNIDNFIDDLIDVVKKARSDIRSDIRADMRVDIRSDVNIQEDMNPEQKRNAFLEKGEGLIHLVEKHIGYHDTVRLNASILGQQGPADEITNNLFTVAKLVLEDRSFVSKRLRSYPIALSSNVNENLTKSLLFMLLQNSVMGDKIQNHSVKSMHWIPDYGLYAVQGDPSVSALTNVLYALNMVFSNDSVRASLIFDNINRILSRDKTRPVLIKSRSSADSPILPSDNALMAWLAYSIGDQAHAEKIMRSIEEAEGYNSRIHLLRLKKSDVNLFTSESVSVGLSYIALGGVFDNFISVDSKKKKELSLLEMLTCRLPIILR